MQIVCPDRDTQARALAGWDPAAEKGRVSSYWARLVIEEEATSSQYDRLRARPLTGASEQPEAWVALRGRGFHGQRRRPWQAVRGNLHLSVSVPLDLPAGPDSLAWTMLPAVAVMGALRALASCPEPDLGIKWVNDILHRGAKVGGVLSSVVQDGERLRRGHLGIGLNIEAAPPLPPGGDAIATGCLARWLSPDQRAHGRVLGVLLGALAANIDLLEQGRGGRIVQAYRADSLVVGRRVRVLDDPLAGPARELCRGRVLAVNKDLSLTLDGQREPVRAGRVFMLEDSLTS